MHEIASDEKWSWGTSRGKVSMWTDFLVQGAHHSSLQMSGPHCRWMLGQSVPLESTEHSSSQHHGLCFCQEAPRPPSCKSRSDSWLMSSHPSPDSAALCPFLGSFPAFPFLSFLPFSSVCLLFLSCPFMLSLFVLCFPLSHSLLHVPLPSHFIPHCRLLFSLFPS